MYSQQPLLFYGDTAMSHMIHYILIAESRGASQEELSCEAASAIERYRNFVFDYLDESPVDENGKYLKALSYLKEQLAFLERLEKLRQERLASYRFKMEILSDSLGLEHAPQLSTADKAETAGRELFSQVHEGMLKVCKGRGNSFLPADISWNLAEFMRLICGEYTFESGFYDATMGYNTIIPSDKDMQNQETQLANDVDLYLVPLDLHF